MGVEISKYNSTHIPILLKVLDRTSGDVLELGTGIYSTPLISYYCTSHGRKAVSFESSPEHISYAKEFENEFHTVHQVDTYDALDIDKQWDLVFLDQFPEEDRLQKLKQLANFSNYIIIHDTQAQDYSGVTTYRYTSKEKNPETSVFSNIINLENF